MIPETEKDGALREMKRGYIDQLARLEGWIIDLRNERDEARTRLSQSPSVICATPGCTSGATGGDCWYCPACFAARAAGIEVKP